MIDALCSIPITGTSTLLQHHPPSLSASIFSLMDTFHLCLSLTIR